MFRWPVVCTLLAALLHGVGCSVKTQDVEGGTQHEKPTVGVQSIRDAVEGPKPGSSAEGSTLQASSGTSLTPPALVNLTYLPVESALIEKDGISANLADEIVESQDAFSKALRDMNTDENRSMEAQDLAKHYRSAVQRAVGTHGAVENLSCGLSVCMGSVTAGSVEDHDAWLSRLQADPGADTYGFIEAIERTGDQFQSRFVFSTDPALRAIMVH